MAYAVIALGATFLLLSVFQVAASLAAAGRFLSRKSAKVPEEDCPRVAVLMALRGADPDLGIGLEKMMTLDYPHYELNIVVESEQDPAWNIVHRAIERTGATERVRVQTLARRLTTCSLHCSSLLQLVDNLPESVEVVALADADVVPHANWLHELVAPLVRGEARAACGLRWFMPPAHSLGGLVRYVWNAYTVVPMQFLGFIWGGSFATWKQDLFRAGVPDAWRTSMAVDAPIARLYDRAAFSRVAVPANVLVNREECRVSGVFAYLTRQFLWVRLSQSLHHWLVCLFLALVFWVLLGFAAAAVLYLVWAGESRLLAWLVASVCCAWGLALLHLAILELAVRQVLKRRGERTGWLSFWALAKMPVVVVAALWISMFAVLRAARIRRLVWRGVTYDLRNRREPVMIADAACPSSLEPRGARHSL